MKKQLIICSCLLAVLALPAAAQARGGHPPLKWALWDGPPGAASYGGVTSGKHGVAVMDRVRDGKTMSVIYSVKDWRGKVIYGGEVTDRDGVGPRIGWVEVDPGRDGYRRDFVVSFQLCRSPKNAAARRIIGYEHCSYSKRI
jgi:hypothetical protein